MDDPEVINSGLSISNILSTHESGGWAESDPSLIFEHSVYNSDLRRNALIFCGPFWNDSLNAKMLEEQIQMELFET